MERAHIKSVALFFFFSLNDERQALRATFKTIEDLKKKASGLKPGEALSSSEVIKASFNNWNQQRKFLSATGVVSPHVEGWALPQGLDLGPWRQFRKQAVPQELIAVIWSRVLLFSDSEVATGLGISIGTLQYRLGNGLKLLGTMTPLGGRNA